jgi:hypothetical protein
LLPFPLSAFFLANSPSSTAFIPNIRDLLWVTPSFCYTASFSFESWCFLFFFTLRFFLVFLLSSSSES